MSKIDAYFVGENTIRAFLTKYGKGYKSKDHEFAIAVHVKRIFEKAWEKECCIAFELKEPLVTPIADDDLSALEKVNLILRDKTREATPVDFAIVIGNTHQHEADGFAFQLKRFGMGITSDFKEKLISYIEKTIPRKIAKSENIGLIVVLDLDENLNDEEMKEIEENFGLEEFSKQLQIISYPFEKIYLLGKDPKLIHLTEVWPNFSQLTLKN
ncbi:MAG: hypothetical protein HYW33_01000 [Candidatus Blackburnbacteria bacterium]|nr:hypothetical protein [Candidatus Blackburnbacteria bacterium]